MSICNHCGTEHQDGKKFCRNCGHALENSQNRQPPPQTANSTELCPECGAKITPGKRFCLHCGAALQTDKKKRDEIKPPPPPQASATPKSGLKAPLIIFALTIFLGMVAGGFIYWNSHYAPPAKKVSPTASVPQPAMQRKPYEPDLVDIKGGCFKMGSSRWKVKDERSHQVCLNDFKIGKYEVTQKQWTDVMGSNPSHFKGCDRCPVDNVNWFDVQNYIQKLNKLTGQKYRLPSEAEWEYSARAGTNSDFSTGSCIDTGQANFKDTLFGQPGCGPKSGTYRKKTLPVGSFKPNAWGLYDMHGNIMEWTCSVYEENYNGAETRCATQSSAGLRVQRGGSWRNPFNFMRSTKRTAEKPDLRRYNFGFRLAR